MVAACPPKHIHPAALVAACPPQRSFNSKLRRDGKKEEARRLRDFVDAAWKLDPRVAAHKQHKLDERERRKHEKHAAKRAEEEAAAKAAADAEAARWVRVCQRPPLVVCVSVSVCMRVDVCMRDRGGGRLGTGRRRRSGWQSRRRHRWGWDAGAARCAWVCGAGQSKPLGFSQRGEGNGGSLCTGFSLDGPSRSLILPNTHGAHPSHRLVAEAAAKVAAADAKRQREYEKRQLKKERQRLRGIAEGGGECLWSAH